MRTDFQKKGNAGQKNHTYRNHCQSQDQNRVNFELEIKQIGGQHIEQANHRKWKNPFFLIRHMKRGDVLGQSHHDHTQNRNDKGGQKDH